MVKKLLDDTEIEYDICTDYDVIANLGIKFVPALDTGDGELLDFTAAMAWFRTGGWRS